MGFGQIFGQYLSAVVEAITNDYLPLIYARSVEAGRVYLQGVDPGKAIHASNFLCRLVVWLLHSELSNPRGAGARLRSALILKQNHFV